MSSCRNNGGAQRRARMKLRRPGETVTHCTWCRQEIYWLDMIPQQNIVKVGPTHIIVDINGYKKHVLVATIDHYFELRNGGTNEVRNLIPSCAPCNRDRSALPQTRPEFCVDCGEWKGNQYKRRCKACVIKRRDEYFAQAS